MLVLRIAAALVFVLAGFTVRAATVLDDAGRRVEVPDTIARVLAAGPPASALLYTLAPEKMIGWVREPSAREKPFLLPAVRDLPAYGRLTGRGNTANVEAVLTAQPDLILDVGTIDPTYVSLADRIQAQTGIPYLLFDGRLERTADLYERLGIILGTPERAGELAAYARSTLATVAERVAAVPADRRPRVYYGRGPEGLETGLAGSINVELLAVVGAVNVAASSAGGGLAQVSLEDVLVWDPAVILGLDAAFVRHAREDPRWSGVAAVRDGRVYKVPTLPYGWFDAPPGVNRLIGVRWLGTLLYPGVFPEDLREETRRYYRLFYQVDPDAAQLDELLAGATGP